MTDSSEINGIKQLIALLIEQATALTTQITELMPLKNISREYRAEEHNIAASLVTRMNTLRQLAKTILDTSNQSEGK